jgi:hypothetical protein
MKRILAYAAMAAIASGMSFPVAAQVNDYTFAIYFYDDASHTNQVGYARPHCTYNFAGATMAWGEVTPYRVEVQAALCVNGELQPE